MRQSVIYQDILQEGRREGISQGKKEEALLFVKRLLQRKFREIDPVIQEKLGNLSLLELEDLGEDLLEFSTITDLEAWLGYPQL